MTARNGDFAQFANVSRGFFRLMAKDRTTGAAVPTP